MRWEGGENEVERDKGCAVGSLLVRHVRREKKCTQTAAQGGVQSARTTSLIQPYNRKLSTLVSGRLDRVGHLQDNTAVDR